MAHGVVRVHDVWPNWCPSAQARILRLDFSGRVGQVQGFLERFVKEHNQVKLQYEKRSCYDTLCAAWFRFLVFLRGQHRDARGVLETVDEGWARAALARRRGRARSLDARIIRVFESHGFEFEFEKVEELFGVRRRVRRGGVDHILGCHRLFAELDEREKGGARHQVPLRAETDLHRAPVPVRRRRYLKGKHEAFDAPIYLTEGQREEVMK